MLLSQYIIILSYLYVNCMSKVATLLLILISRLFLRYLKKVKVKESIAVNGTPSHSYGVSLAVWDHTVLPAIRHKRTHPAFTPARQAGTRFTDHLRVEG